MTTIAEYWLLCDYRPRTAKTPPCGNRVKLGDARDTPSAGWICMSSAGSLYHYCPHHARLALQTTPITPEMVTSGAIAADTIHTGTITPETIIENTVTVPAEPVKHYWGTVQQVTVGFQHPVGVYLWQVWNTPVTHPLRRVMAVGISDSWKTAHDQMAAAERGLEEVHGTDGQH